MMENFNPFRRIQYTILGFIYRFCYLTDNYNLLGIQVSRLVKLAALALFATAWLRRWGNGPVYATLALFLWLQFVYWRSRKLGYYRFVADETATPFSHGVPQGTLAPLPNNQHVQFSATGGFSVKSMEKNILKQPAKYWQVPLGEHVMMVEYKPEHFLYQFFSSRTLQEIQHGCLIHGRTPQRALAISFLSTWGPEFAKVSQTLFGSEMEDAPKKKRTVYFSFDDAESETAVWHNIVEDARRVRSEIGD